MAQQPTSDTVAQTLAAHWTARHPDTTPQEAYKSGFFAALTWFISEVGDPYNFFDNQKD